MKFKSMFAIGIFVLACLGFMSCYNKQISKSTIFNIIGQIDNIPDSVEVSLSYPLLKDDIWIKISESTIVQNGHFSFKGNVESLTEASLYWGNNTISFFIENSDIELYINNNKPYLYTIEGVQTKIQDLTGFEQLLLNNKKNYDTQEELISTLTILNENQLEDSTYKDSLQNRFREIREEREKILKKI